MLSILAFTEASHRKKTRLEKCDEIIERWTESGVRSGLSCNDILQCASFAGSFDPTKGKSQFSEVYLNY